MDREQQEILEELLATGVGIDTGLTATSQDNANHLVEQSGRTAGGTPIRKEFVQRRDSKNKPLAGPLADMVRRRDLRGLLLYLAILTGASAEPWNVSRPAHFWARLLDLSPDKGRPAISKAIGRLRDAKLVAIDRRKRQSNITMLREDATGEPYTYPTGEKGDRYFKLPFEFWTQGWYQQLDMPGVAMLLVLLNEKNDVVLPLDRIPGWYGISRATAQRGFTELENHGLVTTWVNQRPAPLSPIGVTFERHYKLVGSFAKTDTAKPTTGINFLTLPDILHPDRTPSPAQRRRHRRANSQTKRKEEQHDGT